MELITALIYMCLILLCVVKCPSLRLNVNKPLTCCSQVVMSFDSQNQAQYVNNFDCSRIYYTVSTYHCYNIPRSIINNKCILKQLSVDV